MQVWCSGNTSSFQVEAQGSTPCSCTQPGHPSGCAPGHPKRVGLEDGTWACRSTVGLLLCKQIIRVRLPVGPRGSWLHKPGPHHPPDQGQYPVVALRFWSGTCSVRLMEGHIPLKDAIRVRSPYGVPTMGTSFNGRTTVSKTVYRGSNPRGPAMPLPIQHRLRLHPRQRVKSLPGAMQV